MKQGVQTDTTCNIQQCWEMLANNVAFVCMGALGNISSSTRPKMERFRFT